MRCVLTAVYSANVSASLDQLCILNPGMERLRSVFRTSQIKHGEDTHSHQIFIFFLYFCLRMVALSSHSARTSDLAFDILACGACILFPRLVFFLIKDNVVILAVSGVAHVGLIVAKASFAL